MMGFCLLLIGTWLYPANGPESVDRAFFSNAAITLWLCVPFLIYFAWQGYRGMREAAGWRERARRRNPAKRLPSKIRVCPTEIAFGSRVARQREI